MGYYYNYYIGKIRDGKIYPLGPFDENGKIYPVLWRSRSFASDLHDDFYPMKRDMVSEELSKSHIYGEFDCDDDEVDVFGQYNKYLPYAELAGGSYIKSGYYLISDIEAYEATGEDDFEPPLTPTAYAMKLENELKFGSPKNTEDDDYYEHSVKEYAYFSYPDYHCKEYEAAVIRVFINAYVEGCYSEDRDAGLVVIETEG